MSKNFLKIIIITSLILNGCIQSETKFQYEEPEPIDNIKVVDDILGAISNKEIETILNIDVSELEDTLNKKEDFPIVSIDEIKRYLNMTEKELEGMTGEKLKNYNLWLYLKQPWHFRFYFLKIHHTGLYVLV